VGSAPESAAPPNGSGAQLPATGRLELRKPITPPFGRRPEPGSRSALLGGALGSGSVGDCAEEQSINLSTYVIFA
jgi:hypothetical protein